MVIEPSESMVEPTDLFDIQRFPTDKQERSDLLVNRKRKSATSFG